MKTINIKNLVLVALIATGVTFTSCEKTSDVPQIELKFNTVTASFAVQGDLKAAPMAKELAFTSGFITLREVQFQVETDNDSVEVDFEVEMNTKIDFATGETDPDISYAEIPAGTYNEMEVEIELQDEGDEPAIVLEGTYVDVGGTSHPIRFEFNSGETFEIEKEGNITFDVSESALAQVTFDPGAWFAEVSNEQLSSANKNMDGVIVISSTRNAEIFDTVADGLDLATDVELVIQ